MKYNKILITGGAGFVGSNISIKLKKKYPSAEITVLDNLKRKGSELNPARLCQNGVNFVHGDIRNREDIEAAGESDLIIDCSAEPSVMAGIDSSPEYVINTNLTGTINCLEHARRNKAAFIFLSTSRIYPVSVINGINYTEKEKRFSLEISTAINGVSPEGFSEDFPLFPGPRTIYGATKLSSELIIQEYCENYGIKTLINRCGVITGPWQMGKVDQGVVVLWAAAHFFKKGLAYLGFGGKGKQVRDFMHIDDLFNLMCIQIEDFDAYSGSTFNVGGGVNNSFSLLELTEICRDISGNKIKISSDKRTRKGDIKYYSTDSRKIKDLSGWSPEKDLKETMNEIFHWIDKNHSILEKILN